MKFIYTPIAAGLIAVGALSGCASFPQSPAALANSTKLDERLAISAELSYTTASKLGTALAQAHLIDVKRFKALDNEAYGGVLAVRAAYTAGNASDYQTALTQVGAAVVQIQLLVKAQQNAH